MDRIPLLAVILGSLLASHTVTVVAAPKDDRSTECSAATLEGSYIYRTQGYLGDDPHASSGVMSFDGNERVALLYTRSVEREQLTTDGTYTVASNCSGFMRLGTGTVNQFYLGPRGDWFTWVRLTDGGAVGGEAKRVTRGMIVE